MKSINQDRIRALVAAAEQAMTDAGFTFSRIKAKWYEVRPTPGAAPETWILRTSTERDIGFAHDKNGHWPTLDNDRIDKVLIAAFDDAKPPTAKVVYPPIARTDLRPRFVKARDAWEANGSDMTEPRLFVKLDRREGSKAISNVGSGIVEGLTPLASYPLDAHLLPDAPAPRGRPRKSLDASKLEPVDAKPWGASSISMTLDLEEAEHAELAARYAHKLEVDPRRVLVQVRLTVLT